MIQHFQGRETHTSFDHNPLSDFFLFTAHYGGLEVPLAGLSPLYSFHAPNGGEFPYVYLSHPPCVTVSACCILRPFHPLSERFWQDSSAVSKEIETALRKKYEKAWTPENQTLTLYILLVSEFSQVYQKDLFDGVKSMVKFSNVQLVEKPPLPKFNLRTLTSSDPISFRIDIEAGELLHSWELLHSPPPLSRKRVSTKPILCM